MKAKQLVGTLLCGFVSVSNAAGDFMAFGIAAGRNPAIPSLYTVSDFTIGSNGSFCYDYKSAGTNYISYYGHIMCNVYPKDLGAFKLTVTRKADNKSCTFYTQSSQPYLQKSGAGCGDIGAVIKYINDPKFKYGDSQANIQ